MTFTETRLPGVWLIDADLFPDHRGAFVLTWTPEPFEARGLDTRIAQVGIAVNIRRGTIRGLHYQRPPLDEAKQIRVVRGAIFDVAVDLRPDSPTFCHWVGVTLTADNRRMLYLPPGFAHGFCVTSAEAEVLYLTTEEYAPELEHGIPWNDPALNIAWPIASPILSPRDTQWPAFRPEQF